MDAQTMKTQWQRLYDGKLFSSILYCLTALPIGIIGFTLAVTGFSLGIGLAITWIGIPILAFTLMVCRSLMEWDRQWLYYITGRGNERADGLVKRLDHKPGLLAWMKRQFTAPGSYGAFLMMILKLPIGILMFTFAIVFPVLALASLLAPIAQYVSIEAFQYDLFSEDNFLNVLFPDYSAMEKSFVQFFIGLVLILPSLYLFNLMVRVHAAIYRAFDSRSI